MSMRANYSKNLVAATAASAVLLSGCGVMIAGSTKAGAAIEGAETLALQLPKLTRTPPKAPVDQDDRVRVVSDVFIPTEDAAASATGASGAWLKEIKGLGLGSSDRGLPISQIVPMLSARGVNVSSDLPLHSYVYSGVVNPTDAEAFLKQVLGTVGLDFVADDARRSIAIRPLPEKTWFFNASKQAGGIGGGDVGSGSTTVQVQSAGNGYGAGYPGGMPGGMSGGMPGMGQQNGLSQQMPRLNGGGSTGAAGGGSFWSALEKEIKERLTVLVPAQQSSSAAAAVPGAMGAVPPTAMVPPFPPGMQSQPAMLNSPLGNGQPMAAGMGSGIQVAINQMPGLQASPVQGGPAFGAPGAPGAPGAAKPPESGVSGFQTKTMGTYSINPDTGAVTVQAPSWILASLDTYFAKVRSMQNAEISFEGLLILVANDGSTSEGFDIQGFTKWLSGKYQFFASSNPLGGVTLSFPEVPGNGVPRANANGPVNGPLIGINKPDGLRLFNAYLEERGRFKVLQQPVISTTSDAVATFERTTTKYFNTVSQDVGQSQTNTQLATKNVINSVELGTILRVHPKLEESNGSGLVRTKLFLSQITSSGTQNVIQTITVGATSQPIVVPIPLLAKMKYEGEALMKDGDLLIVGGQKEESASITDNGLPGFDGPTLFGGLTGSRVATNTKQTTYFALQVRVNKKK